MGCASSKHAPDVSERVRAASNPTTNVAATSLVDLPSGINHVVVESLDPISLARLGMTCSLLRQLVFHDVDWKWKECHDETWSCGKRSRLDCLPSQRPRNGNGNVTIDLGGMSWQEEFARRANLDNMVPAFLKGDPAVFLQFVEDNQSDIFNKLVAIANQDSAAAAHSMVDMMWRTKMEFIHCALAWINVLEACSDFESLFQSVVVGAATVFDAEMVVAKLKQSASFSFLDFLNKRSPDDIYDEINCEMGALTVGQVLENFEVDHRVRLTVSDRDFADCADLHDLQAVLEKRKGRERIIDCIVARLIGTSELLDEEDWDLFYARQIVAGVRGGLHRSFSSSLELGQRQDGGGGCVIL